MNNIFKFFFLFLVTFMNSTWADSKEDPIHIWGTCVSPYVRKVVSVLEEKQLNYELHPILPTILLEATNQPIPVEFQEISPLGKIPVLQISSFSIADSAVIVSYLERKWPSHPVYPLNNENFAKALWYEKYADTVMTDVFHQLFLEKFVKPNVLKTDVNEQLIDQLLDRVPAILDYLDKELIKNKKLYLVEDHLTAADMAIIHHFVGLQLSQIELPLDSHPTLKNYLKRTLNHPSIQAAIKKI